MWDVLCVTCLNADLAIELEKDLLKYQECGVIPINTQVMVVPDPKANIGSGGATFNAVLTVAERLSLLANYSVINISCLQNKRILIMLMGRDFQFDVSGRGLFFLPCCYESKKLSIPLPNYLHAYLTISQQVAVGSPPGVWVTSTDIFVSLSEQIYNQFDWTKPVDMYGLSVPASIDVVADKHAAYRLNNDDTVADILYRLPKEALSKRATSAPYCQQKDQVLSLLGIVYLSPSVVEAIFTFYEVYPLNACTYMGIDSGAVPIKLSILMDVMRAAASEVSAETFASWNNASDVAKRARHLIYEKLSSCSYKIVVDKGGKFLFPDIDEPGNLFGTLVKFSHHLNSLPLSSLNVTNSLHSHCFVESKVNEKTSAIINSFIDANVQLGTSCVITNTIIEMPTIIGNGSIVNGLEASLKDIDKQGSSKHDFNLYEMKMINIPAGVVLHQFPVRIPSCQLRSDTTVNSIVVFGLKDKLTVPVTNDTIDDLTFCNLPLKQYLANKLIDETDLWPHSTPPEQRTLSDAKLYPLLSKSRNLSLALWLTSSFDDSIALRRWRSSWRLSINELQSLVDHPEASKHRLLCFSKVACSKVARNLSNYSDSYILPMYHTSVAHGFAMQMITVLDKCAAQTLDETKLARILANVAALLACMSGAQGGIRSGPSKNIAWEKAYSMLSQGDYEYSLQVMQNLRAEWMDSPQLLMRASRHYEGACYTLIKKACLSSKMFICPKINDRSKVLGRNSTWIIAEAPARADIAGGWSDSPPMSYEIGGAVLNVALTINKKKPIGARTRKLFETTGIVLGLLDNSTSIDVRQHFHFDSISQLSKYDHSYGQATIVKVCLFVTGIVQPVTSSQDDKEALKQQLLTAFSSPGIEIQSWADLPEGSGLGTRSILTGTILAAIWTLAGRSYDIETLCHAVVQCEQLMGTCGGWQDPIGGLVGGVKLAYCLPSLPLHLQWKPIGFKIHDLERLNRKLVLIYGGNRSPFGASTVSFNVVRNWYTNEPESHEAALLLPLLAKNAVLSLEQGVSDDLGSIMTQSHKAKTLLAPGSESESFKQIINLLAPVCSGATINGCGDGGFMTVLLTDNFCGDLSKEKIIEKIERMIEDSEIRNNFGDEIAVHHAAISAEGLTVWQQQ